MQELNITLLLIPEEGITSDGDTVMRDEDTRVKLSIEIGDPKTTTEPVETDIMVSNWHVVGLSHMDDMEGGLEDMEDLPNNSLEYEIVIRKPEPWPKPTI